MSEFLSVALFVGLTISVDIFFYTLAKSSVETLTWRNWTIPAATAHVVLMGIVVGMFYILGHSFHFLRFPLGLLGAVVIGRYLFELSCDWRGIETQWSLTKTLESQFGNNWLLSWLKASVLAVSWDCIPVAAGITSETDTWSLPQLLVGIITIGITVAFATQTSIVISDWVKRRVGVVQEETKVAGLLVGNWLVLSLLGGFFFIAIIKSFAPWFASVDTLEVSHTLPVSAALATIFFLWYRKVLWEQAKSGD